MYESDPPRDCGLEITQYLALKVKTMDVFLVVFKAALLCLSLCTRSVFSDEGLEAVCPQRETAFPWNDPNDVDKRIWKLASQEWVDIGLNCISFWFTKRRIHADSGFGVKTSSIYNGPEVIWLGIWRLTLSSRVRKATFRICIVWQSLSFKLRDLLQGHKSISRYQ